jgi:acyl-CoA reductase-like NAD-dependent aldehyde dehydrogenase
MFRNRLIFVRNSGKLTHSRFGLYASVYTKNIDRALRFAKGLEAGTVGVNCTSPVTGIDMPFGGCTWDP